MSRPGHVLEVDEKSPATLFWRGTEMTTERLPPGSRIVHAPEPGTAPADPLGAIDEALRSPLGTEPLAARLRPETRLTIVFNDDSTPLLGTKSTDGRAEAIEAVLELAADAGVDDVVLLAARGLHRRMTDNELRRVVGERAYDSFAPKNWLRQHDAEDPKLLTDGYNERIAQSDLIVYVNLVVSRDDCEWDTFARSVADRRIDDVAPVVEALRRHDVFVISITVDTRLPPGLDFLTRREREWRIRDKVRSTAATLAGEVIPPRISRQLLRRVDSPRVVTSVNAGDFDSVAEATRQVVSVRSTTEVNGESDIVTFGVPGHLPSGTGEIQDPISAAYSGLVTILGRGQRVVRNGGAVVMHHPMRPEFHTARRPSYVDFFDEGLVEPDECERRLAEDRWLTHLYSNGFAEHPIAPARAWAEVRRVVSRLSQVVVVGGESATVQQLGFKAATTFEDGIEMARDAVGGRSVITQLHVPPVFGVTVR